MYCAQSQCATQCTYHAHVLVPYYLLPLCVSLYVAQYLTIALWQSLFDNQEMTRGHMAMRKLGRANASIFSIARARANKSEFKGTSNGRGQYTVQSTRPRVPPVAEYASAGFYPACAHVYKHLAGHTRSGPSFLAIYYKLYANSWVAYTISWVANSR